MSTIATENRIPDTIIDEVRRRTDLSEIVAYTGVKLQERGRGDFWGQCPWHVDHTPSFHVLRDRGIFKCFSCQEGGSVFKYLELTEGMKFIDALAWLGERCGIDVPGYAPPKIARRPIVVTGPAEPDPQMKRDKRIVARDKYWTPALPIAGTPVETYLAEARHIHHDVFRDLACLRYLPNVPYWAPSHSGPRGYEVIHSGPGMVAALQTPSGGFAGAHVTYLEADGSGKIKLCERAPSLDHPGDKGDWWPAKKIFGTAGGAHIRLGPIAEHMAVGEGIETALSCTTAGGPIAWAAGSLNNICGAGRVDGYRQTHPINKPKKLPTRVPDMNRPGFLWAAEVRHGLLLGDGDTSDQFMLKALLARAQRRFEQMGVLIDVKISPPGTDFNDILRFGIPQESQP